MRIKGGASGGAVGGGGTVKTTGLEISKCIGKVVSRVAISLSFSKSGRARICTPDAGTPQQAASNSSKLFSVITLKLEKVKKFKENIQPKQQTHH